MRLLIGLLIAAAAFAQGGPPYNGSAGCVSASSLQLPLGTPTVAGGDVTPSVSTMLTNAGTTGSVCVVVDCGKSIQFLTQLVKPVDGASLEIYSCGRAWGSAGGTVFMDYTGASNGGYTILNLATGSGATGSFINIHDVNVRTSNGNTNPFIFSSTSGAIHHSAITCAGKCVVVGGQNACCSARSGTKDDWFNGDFYFGPGNRMAGCIELGSSANEVPVFKNQIGPGSAACHNLINLNGPAGGNSRVRGGSIIGNNLELGTSDVGIAFHNTTNIDVFSNKCYDGTSAVCIGTADDASNSTNTFFGNSIDGSGGNTMYGASPHYPESTSLVIDLLTPLFQFPSKLNLQSGLTTYLQPNYIASETGGANAIAGALTDGKGNNVTLAAGLCVSVKLAHGLQAGANTFNLNAGGAVAIKSARNVANNIGTAWASGGIWKGCYDGTQWQDVSQ